MMKIAVILLMFLSIAFQGAAQCNVIYVTTTGSGTGDSQTDPSSIENAFGVALPGDLIRLGTGNYVLTNPLVLASSGVIIEGGFDAGNNWNKTSLLGATTLTRTATN